MTSADATEIINLQKIFVVPLLFRKGSLRSFRLERQRAFGYDERNFHLQRFDLASKVGMLQSTTRTQLDQLKGALSGFEAISKETIWL
jgi:exonuclease SbcC